MTPESEPLSLLAVAKWLLSALGAMALWVASLFKKRLEAVEVNHTQLVEKVRMLELETVSRDTHQRHETDINAKLDTMRKESFAKEERIITEIRSLGTRIDTLFQRPDR